MSPKNASKCIVRGCKSKDMVGHRFPNPRNDLERLKEWIELVGLNDMDPETVYRNKFICAIHFTEDCSSPGTNRLKMNSIPTLSIPRFDVEQSLRNSEREIPRKNCDISGMEVQDVVVSSVDLNISGIEPQNYEIDQFNNSLIHEKRARTFQEKKKNYR